MSGAPAPQGAFQAGLDLSFFLETARLGALPRSNPQHDDGVVDPVHILSIVGESDILEGGADAKDPAR